MRKEYLISKAVAIVIALMVLGTSYLSGATGSDHEQNDRGNNTYKRIFTENGWWNSEWAYRRLITIDHTKVSADQQDFPLLISYVSSDFILHAQSDGDDFVCTNKENTVQYDHEIEYYNGTTGELIAWVCLPLLSSVQDTSFYLYYGNALCSNQQHVENTWDEHYIGVHHLEEVEGIIEDSTSHHNDGIPQGDLNQDSIGFIDGADYFDGSDDNITLPHVYSTETQFTMEAWIYPEPEARYIFAQRITYIQGVLLQITEGCDYLQWFINNVSDGRSGIPWGTWSYVVLSYDGTTARLYLNNEEPYLKECAVPVWPASPMLIGDRSSGDRRFHGVIDEVRFSNIARDPSWITACFTNQNDTMNFLTVGDEENQSSPNNPPYTPVNPLPENNSVDVSLHPTLSVFVEDPENDTMTVSFYNASDDSIIDTVTLIPSGTRAEITWEHLTYNTTYRWYVVVNDSLLETRSDTWVFTTQTSEQNPPVVTIVKPIEKSFYFRDKRIVRFPKILIFGYITITAEAHDDNSVVQVEFYIDGVLKNISTTPTSGDTFSWIWNERCWLKAKHTITVIAIDTDGKTDEDTLIVSIHNFPWLHPRKP